MSLSVSGEDVISRPDPVEIHEAILGIYSDVVSRPDGISSHPLLLDSDFLESEKTVRRSRFARFTIT